DVDTPGSHGLGWRRKWHGERVADDGRRCWDVDRWKHVTDELSLHVGKVGDGASGDDLCYRHEHDERADPGSMGAVGLFSPDGGGEVHTEGKPDDPEGERNDCDDGEWTLLRGPSQEDASVNDEGQNEGEDT